MITDIEKRKAAALEEMPSPKMQTSLAPEWYVSHYKTIRELLAPSPQVPDIEVDAFTIEETCAGPRLLFNGVIVTQRLGWTAEGAKQRIKRKPRDQK